MRLLRWIGAVLVAALALVALVVLLLVTTSPDPESADAWSELPRLPAARGEVGSTVVERDGRPLLVAAGGFSRLTAATVADVHAFDPRARRWHELPDLPAAVHHPGAAAIEGDIYVSGGAPSATDRTAQESMWVLREGHERWEARSAMPEGREAHRMRAVGDRLYVVGGRGGETSDVLVYDVARDAWSRAAALPVPRHHIGLVLRDGELWALGGRDDDEQVLDDVHVWRPGDPAWREGPRLPRPVSGAVEGLAGGEIHLVGGEDPTAVGGEVIDTHLVLDPEARRWREEPPPPLAVHGAAGGVIDGRLLMAGGARRQGFLSPLAWTDFAAAHDPGG